MRYSSVGISLSLGLILTGCGGSDGGDSSAQVSLLFSDAPVNIASKVVVTVDTITFNRPGGEDIVVDTFTSDDLGIVDADTFTIDLLEVQGNDYRLVIDSVELPIGDYSNIRIGILDEDVALSYVEEEPLGGVKPLKVPSDELKLGGFTVGEASTQTFVVEFGLQQSLVYNPGPPGQDRYILKPRGVRVVDLQDASTLMGSVALDTIHTVAPCDSKPDSQAGNVAYLYNGHDLDPNLLADNFVSEDAAEPGEVFDPNAPDNIIAPAVSVEVVGGDVNGYLFSFLESGDYTLTLSCVAENDDPITYDNIMIAAPSTELVEISLGVEEMLVCDFPLVDGSCANQVSE